MSSISLYVISHELSQLMDQIDPETGEISPELGDMLSKFDKKGQAVAAYILNQEATSAAILAHVEKMSGRMLQIKKRNDSLRRYMQEAMKAAGVTEINSDDGTFSVKLHLERDESVDIFQPELVPANYMTTPSTPLPAPSKALIKAAIKKGEEVPGARIVKKDRLTIG